MKQLLYVYQFFQNCSSTSKSVKKPTTTTSHYSHLSVTLTPTLTRQQLTIKSDTKQSVFESETKQFDEENEYNDYETKSMNKNCVDA